MKTSKKDLPKTIQTAIAAAFPAYRGRKFSTSGLGSFHYEAGKSGGTWSLYVAVELATGKLQAAEQVAPWDPRNGGRVAVPAGYAVLEHAYFCGQDAGITVHYAGGPAFEHDARRALLGK